MAIENDGVAAAAGAKEQSVKPAEEFISLGDADDFTLEAASDVSTSDSDSDSESESDSDSDDEETTPDEDTFHPHRMTLSTFRSLLACYPTTVEQVHRRKAMLKLQPKPERGSKRRAEKKAGSASANLRGAMLLQKTDFNPSEEKYIKEETEKFLTLDKWRYEEMPQVMGERKEKEAGEVLNKNDLITIMDWKTKHGIPRPTLMGMVKSNQNKNVLKCSSAAIAALSAEDPMLAPNEAFPKPSIDAFGPLRGVGVATASLILSIATATGNPKQQVPFYSDDSYLWLCLKEFPEPEADEEEDEEEEAASEEQTADTVTEDGKKPPRPPKFRLKRKISKFKRPNGELNVKYNIAEYRKLWDASWELRERLNRAVEADADSNSDSSLISHIDIEKTAYVLRNIAVSGYFENQDPEDILRTAERQKARVDAAVKAEKARADASGETAAREKKLAMKKQKKKDKEEMRAKQKEQKALQKKRKIANGGRNAKRRKVE